MPDIPVGLPSGQRSCTREANQALAGQGRFGINHVVEAAGAEAAFQAFIPRLEPTLGAADRAAAAPRPTGFMEDGLRHGACGRSPPALKIIQEPAAHHGKLCRGNRCYCHTNHLLSNGSDLYLPKYISCYDVGQLYSGY